MSVISEADVECPMRCIGVPLNFEMLAAQYAKLRSNGDVRHASEEDGFISLFNADSVLQQGLLRLLALAGQKLGPSARAQSQLILQEIMPALLQSEGGSHLISMLQHNSADQRIHLAANYIRDHLTEDRNVDALPGMFHMIPSTFFRRIKAVTKITPLKYQKLIRLFEISASSASNLLRSRHRPKSGSCAPYRKIRAPLSQRAPAR